MLKVKKTRAYDSYDCWGRAEYCDGYVVTDELGSEVYHSVTDPTELIKVLTEALLEKPSIKLTTSKSGDWQILEVDGVEWASGHRISEFDWIRLIGEYFGVKIDKEIISDEEMELRN